MEPKTTSRMTKSARILVVDDFASWHVVVSKIVQNQPGFEVIADAYDGVEAVQKAQQLKPDLILLDIGLPQLNGIEAARLIREHSSCSKILFFTENTSPEIAQEALKTGASGYVVKSDAARDLLPAVTAVLEGQPFVSCRFAGHDFGETLDACAWPEKGHVVQFYENDAHLLDNLDTLFSEALADGGSVAAVMTAPHRTGMEERLTARGIGVAEATKEGRLVMLDADQTLSEFMDLCGPNRERFLLVCGDVVGKAEAIAAQRSRVVVFGEMVAVLSARRQFEAAIHLERLWNELAQTHSFYLCCAYPISKSEEALTCEPYRTICAEHTQVVSVF